jgi:hypothetical protein
VAFGDKNVEVVNKFLNLGHKRPMWVWRYSEESKLQIGAFAARQTKLTIYKILIQPVLLCGSETWVLTKRKKNRLLVFERKILRKIYVDGVYRSSYNIDLDRQFNRPNVIDIVKEQ